MVLYVIVLAFIQEKHMAAYKGTGKAPGAVRGRHSLPCAV